MKRKIHIGIVAIGMIILFIGFWFAAVKAGIPYQDPTPEMLEQYSRSMTIGSLLLMIGGGVVLAELIYWVAFGIYKLLKRRS